MDPDDIELTRSSYGGSVPSSPDKYNEINLDEEEQEELKELMRGKTIEQLNCIADCCRSLADKMRRKMEETTTVDDFLKAKGEDVDDDNDNDTDKEEKD